MPEKATMQCVASDQYISDIPDIELRQLATPLIDKVTEYFNDPKVLADFEVWMQRRQASV